MRLPTILPFIFAPLVFSNTEIERVHKDTLQWDVYLVPPVPTHPLNTGLAFSPTAVTLIHGPKTAILVDTGLNVAVNEKLADWIKKTIPNKKLTHVYITHGHGDHFFGIPVLQSRFPGLIPVATAHTIDHIKQQLALPYFHDFWEAIFPDQIPAQTEVLTPLPHSGELYVDGHVLRAVEVGQSDTYNTTVLHVPSIDLVIGGDVIYGECHQFFMETNTTALRNQWLSALARVEQLKPKHVVPSHRQAWDGFGLDHIEKTKNYIRTWEREHKLATDAKDLEARMKRSFPQRIGEFILRLSAEGVPPA